ncbi:MAG: CHAT domain-containing protein, partial [Gammaproteobacteria bacterium]
QAFERGAFELAAEGWTQAAAGYEGIGDRKAQGATLVRLAEAYQALGQHRLALQALQAADELIGEDPKSSQRALVLWSTGRLYLALGQPADAQRHLREALQLARTREQPGLAAGILIDLGNAYGAESKHAEALAAYTESAQLAERSGHTAVLARAMINRAVTSSRIGQDQAAKADLDQAMTYLERLPASHDKSYDLTTAGLSYQQLRAHLPNAQADLSQRALAALREAADSAEANGDPRAASYAWGHQGALHETDRRYQDALELTQRAIFKAQQAAAPEALYRWHSQAGRLHHASGRMDEAIAAHRRAVFALQSIRPELVLAAARASAGSFRETYGAVYFDLVDLLLQRASSLPKRPDAEPYLKEARDTVELFKIDEMRDYFRDDCVDAARSHITALETVSKTAAVIYPILLPDRTELLVSLPGGMRRVSVPVTAEPLTREIRVLRKYLEKRTTQEYLPHAQRLYDWLIRPLEPELAGTSIDTLVFVPDGPLRTIPMAALHDGKQFLISKYAVATTPGLT